MLSPISTAALRELFLEFFQRHDHRRIEGARLIPREDPTLLFINSGMAPLKRYFTGEARPPHPDLCNVQPCLRTVDIEAIGDRHHLTFFEMLGSWSIGNYFKERAIELAFELLTEVFEFPAERLYATVFAGDPEVDVPADEASASIWERVGLRPDQIVPLGADNFWGPAGDTGPCGPCTEVFFDTGEEFGPAYSPGAHFDDKSRYVEIWNAGVFMEYDLHADGRFERLPFVSVDTGAGLERLAMTMNGLPTVYETDVLAPIMSRVAEAGADGALSVPDRRLLSDHVRATTFILGEGVEPSNEGRGYIPRRLVRKCLAVVTRAGLRDFDFGAVIDAVVEGAQDFYPHLRSERAAIERAFERERRDFARVVERGLSQLEALAAGAAPQIAGADAFSLFATYGLPLELVVEFARERGGAVDEAGFRAELERHRETSRARDVLRSGAGRADPRLEAVTGAIEPTAFRGYERLRDEATVIRVGGGAADDVLVTGERGFVVVDETPFYAEAGGQVGDRGFIRGGGAELVVHDTTKTPNGVHVHHVEVSGGELRPGAVVALEVDVAVRRPTEANHSATHLLNAALRHQLGDHVRQAGSLVAPDRLRFDFTHSAPVGREAFEQIEREINRTVLADLPREVDLMPYEEAVRAGALTVPGESYPEIVRVVRFGDASVELCGGTHVEHLGAIGLVKLVSEESVKAGVRRIVAVSSEAALDLMLERDRILTAVAARLGTGVADVPKRVESLLSRGAREPRRAETAPSLSRDELERRASEVAPDVRVFADRVDVSLPALRELALRYAAELRGAAVLASVEDGKVRLVAAVAEGARGALDASALIGAVAPLVGGRGGGNARLAQGGGTDADRVEALIEHVPQAARSLLDR